MFFGKPPNTCLPMIIATALAAAKAYHGVDGETDNASSKPVTIAPPSLYVNLRLNAN